MEILKRNLSSLNDGWIFWWNLKTGRETLVSIIIFLCAIVPIKIVFNTGEISDLIVRYEIYIACGWLIIYCIVSWFYTNFNNTLFRMLKAIVLLFFIVVEVILAILVTIIQCLFKREYYEAISDNINCFSIAIIYSLSSGMWIAYFMKNMLRRMNAFGLVNENFFVWLIIIFGTVTLYRTFFAKICCKILARETIIEKLKAETQHFAWFCSFFVLLFLEIFKIQDDVFIQLNNVITLYLLYVTLTEATQHRKLNRDKDEITEVK